MGGVLALRLGIHHPRQITGVVALSTPTRFRGGWQVRLVPLARYFVDWFYPLTKLDFNNPKVQAEVLKQARQRDPISPSTSTIHKQSRILSKWYVFPCLPLRNSSP